jgi:hypothetical protein
MTEVSCGYHCDVDETPGEFEGQRYDRVQRNIRYNHVAVVERGRAGDAKLRLDSNDDVRLDAAQETMMKVERIDGVEYEIGSDAHKAILAARESFAQAKSEKDKAQARADVAEGRVKDLEGKLAEAQDQKRIDAAVAARLDVVEKARKVLGADFKAEGKNDREIKAEALKKARPEMKLDGKSDDYVAAAFDMLADRVDAESTAALRTDAASATRVDTDEYPDPAKARTEMVARHRNLSTAKA